jgi:uncharacterized protein YjiS (DUF1127 family)
MLISFSASNFRSIEEEIQLDFISTRRDAKDNIDARSINSSVVSKAVIFGGNATGKTNLLAAYLWLVEFSRTSLFQWADGIPTQPFLFRNGAANPTTFTVQLEIDRVLFRYEVKLDSSGVEIENLDYWPNGRRKKVFSRIGLDLSASREFGSTKGPRTLLSKTVLISSVARKFDLGPASRFAEAFHDVLALDIRTGLNVQIPINELSKAVRAGSNLGWFTDEPEMIQPRHVLPIDLDLRKKRALALLQLADNAIRDIDIEDREVEQVAQDGMRIKTLERKITFEHSNALETISLDFFFESRGTQKWFAMLSPLLAALEFGSLIMIDEMDSSLHPILVSKILELFSRRDLNPLGAQLLITVHDATLLNVLHPDQVWFAEKNESGSTVVFPLSTFRANQISQQTARSRQYLDGRFGGVPEIHLDSAADAFSEISGRFSR